MSKSAIVDRLEAYERELSRVRGNLIFDDDLDRACHAAELYVVQAAALVEQASIALQFAALEQQKGTDNNV